MPASKNLAPEIRTVEADLGNVGVIYFKDVEFSRPNDYTLYLQILEPDKSGPGAVDASTHPETYPLVVFIQGSGWRKQSTHLTVPILSSIARRGYVVASLEYRPTSIAPFPAQVEDAQAAVRFLLEHADDYQVDQKNLFLWGDSSGGHSAFLASIRPALAPMVKGIIDFYGPTDLLVMSATSTPAADHDGPDSPEGMLLGGKRISQNPELARQASPLHVLQAETVVPPVLILHGDQDNVVAFEQSVALYEKLNALGKAVTFYCVKGGAHGGRQFWSEAVLGVVVEFLEQHRS